MLPSASGEKMSINMNMNVVSYLPRPSTVDRRWKPNVEVAPNCPRCDSSNTKFCYYNNYSLTQPRYFCKGCRRYWTKGGSLRNVPVGGGCRKNRRGKLVRSRQLMTTSSAPSRQLQGNSVPPDHVLVDNPPIGRGSNGPLSSSTDTSNSDGSAIDLAVLYARFSNNHGGPEFESTAITGASDHQLPVENFHGVEFTGTTNPDYQSTSIAGIDCQIPSLIPTGEVHQLGSGFLQSELDFNFNTGVSCGSQYLIDEGLISTADIFWSGGCSPTTISNSIWQQTSSQTQLGFVPPPLEDSSVLLINPNLTNTNWNMFDSSSFEARS